MRQFTAIIEGGNKQRVKLRYQARNYNDAHEGSFRALLLYNTVAAPATRLSCPYRVLAIVDDALGADLPGENVFRVGVDG